MQNACHCSTGLVADEIAQHEQCIGCRVMLQSYVGVMFALFCWRYGLRLNTAQHGISQVPDTLIDSG